MAPQGSILVTGSNGTLGFNIVDQIVSKPATADKYYGLYTVRNPAKAPYLAGVLAKAPKTHQHEVLPLDFDHLQSVRDFAADVNARVAAGALPPIRALVWNAGFQETDVQTFTDDGFDRSFQSNYLGHWLLTVLLLGSMDKKDGRIVIVGSWTHDATDGRNKMGGPDYYSEDKWKTVFTDPDSLAKGKYSPAEGDTTGRAGMRRYGASKLCEVMMVRELQERLDKDPALSNISVLAVDPGGMLTQLLRHNMLFFARSVINVLFVVPLVYTLTLFNPNPLMRFPSKSAHDVLRASLDSAPPPLSDHPKGLHFNGNEPRSQGPEALDAAKTGALWRASIGYTGLKEGETVLKAWN